MAARSPPQDPNEPQDPHIPPLTDPELPPIGQPDTGVPSDFPQPRPLNPDSPYRVPKNPRTAINPHRASDGPADHQADAQAPTRQAE